MKYVRWIGIVILIILMGYLSAIGLFADSSIAEGAGVILVFLSGCAGVGALIPERWQLSALCSWGAVLFSVLEIGFTVARGPVPGQNPRPRCCSSELVLSGLLCWVGISVSEYETEIVEST